MSDTEEFCNWCGWPLSEHKGRKPCKGTLRQRLVARMSDEQLEAAAEKAATRSRLWTQEECDWVNRAALCLHKQLNPSLYSSGESSESSSSRDRVRLPVEAPT